MQVLPAIIRSYFLSSVIRMLEEKEITTRNSPLWEKRGKYFEKKIEIFKS